MFFLISSFSYEINKFCHFTTSKKFGFRFISFTQIWDILTIKKNHQPKIELRKEKTTTFSLSEWKTTEYLALNIFDLLWTAIINLNNSNATKIR